ncbi:MAG: Fimbrial protein precursor [Candidatus Omnitrophica bacterium ADurb.Bin277]|nr:MAG: Fimbrial protein precursor [Candidatus Omnitrophica bacterium ADurb.Bin277]
MRIAGKESKGFTLIEVLIVIVIISVLAALVIPRFTGHGERARAAEAVVTLGALHRAMAQYFDEVGEYPALNSTDDIDRELGIGITVTQGWKFSTAADGSVTASLGAGEGASSLTLNIDGTWGGAGDYAPGGKYSPYLPGSANAAPDP